MLGFKLFSDQMSDPELVKLAEKVGPQEGMEFCGGSRYYFTESVY